MPTPQNHSSLALADQLRESLARPEAEFHWRDLEKLKIPGLTFVGHWGTHDLKLGEQVVLLSVSKKTSHPALIVGTIDQNPEDYNFCVRAKVEAIVTPKNESPESVGVDLNHSYLFGGFQVFRTERVKQLGQHE